MCGVFGFVAGGTGSLSRQEALASIHSMTHRGPDGFGIWQGDEVTLGHRRLSILDLDERARQPMAYADGRYQLTFNGEVYNFMELRTELEKMGHSFVTQSDSEVVLAAFAQWGERCLDRFNGMWSLGIWDRKERRLFLSRDRWGKKPLFYAYVRGGLAFASEMKALLPLLPEVKPNLGIIKRLDRMFTYEATADTLVEGVYRFLPAHMGWYKPGGKVESKRWWCTLDHLPASVPTRFEEQAEQLRELLFEACRIRMRSDVPVGTALSGGLDSSSTISAMVAIMKAGKMDRGTYVPTAVVSSFPGTPLDETPFAQSVIDHLKVPGVIVQVDPAQVVDQIERSYYLFEDLYITSPIPFMATYGEVRKRGITVTLDGHAGDELFCGYTSDLQFAVLREAGWNPLQARSAITAYLESIPKDLAQFGGTPSKLRYFAKTRKQWLHELKHSSFELIRSKDEKHPNWAKLSPLNQRLYVHTHETTLPTLLRNYDRLSMSNGVEIRMPFLDHRIVTFAFGLPWTSKVRGGFSKAVLRKAMEPYMPPDITWRRTKVGWSTPIVNWLKGPWKEFTEDLIESQSFKNCTLIDPARVSQRLRRVIDDPQAKYDDAQNTWMELTPYLWENAFIKNWRKHFNETAVPAERAAEVTSSPAV